RSFTSTRHRRSTRSASKGLAKAAPSRRRWRSPTPSATPWRRSGSKWMRRRSSRNSSCVQRGQADIAKIKVQYLPVSKKLGHSYGGPRVRISLPPAANPVQTVHSFGLRPLAPSPHSHEWHLATGRRFKSSRGRHFVSLQRLRPGPLCDNVEIPSHAS